MYLTTHEVAKKLNLSYNTIYAWVVQGKLPAFQIGKRYKIDEDELTEFLKTKKVKVKNLNLKEK